MWLCPFVCSCKTSPLGHPPLRAQVALHVQQEGLMAAQQQAKEAELRNVVEHLEKQRWAGAGGRAPAAPKGVALGESG